jgi:hypothetical protein
MTHRGGLSLSIIIWRIGGGGPKFPFVLGPKNYLGVTNVLLIQLHIRLLFELHLNRFKIHTILSIIVIECVRNPYFHRVVRS